MTTWLYGRQTPDNNLMRLVARRFTRPAKFLDIGSGEGSNERELKGRGHWVFTIDINRDVDADWCGDIREASFPDRHFDCVYDINTLCHVEGPPFAKIKSWLKPDGYFFSIWPAYGTSERVKEGKKYTHLVTEYDLRLMLKLIFSEVKFGFTDYRLPDSESYQSWIVEARP